MADGGWLNTKNLPGLEPNLNSSSGLVRVTDPWGILERASMGLAAHARNNCANSAIKSVTKVGYDTERLTDLSDSSDSSDGSEYSSVQYYVVLISIPYLKKGVRGLSKSSQRPTLCYSRAPIAGVPGRTDGLFSRVQRNPIGTKDSGPIAEPPIIPLPRPPDNFSTYGAHGTSTLRSNGFMAPGPPPTYRILVVQSASEMRKSHC